MFCIVFYLVTGELIALNTVFFTAVPWSLPIAIVLTGVLIATLGRKWSGYRIFAVPEPTSWLVAYVVLAALACVLIALMQGVLLSVRLVPLSLPNSPGPLVVITYALLFPPLAAVAEEVGVRGILQGNLETSLGSRAAFLVAGALFVAMHAMNPAFVAQLGVSVGVAFAAGAVATRTQSIAPGIGIHVLANTCLAALPAAVGPVSLRDTRLDVSILMGLAALVVVAAAWCIFRKLGSACRATSAER